MYSFKETIEGINFTNNLREDSYNLLLKYERHIVANHSREVADECIRMARIFGEDEKKAEIAGLLHDIGAVYLNSERLDVSKKLGIEVLKEEEELPLILHQKISRVMAMDIWNIEDEEILSAINCHTTLKKNPCKMDLILFVADKLKWDQKGNPPYLHRVKEGLSVSLEKGAYEYIAYMMETKDKLKVVHPWLREAYEHLKNINKKKCFINKCSKANWGK